MYCDVCLLIQDVEDLLTELTDPRAFIEDIVQMSSVSSLSSALVSETTPVPTGSMLGDADGSLPPHQHYHHHGDGFALAGTSVGSHSTSSNYHDAASSSSLFASSNASLTGSLSPAVSLPPLSSSSSSSSAMATHAGSHAHGHGPHASASTNASSLSSSSSVAIALSQRSGENTPVIVSVGAVGL